jgi:multidrug resistance efflux pump
MDKKRKLIMTSIVVTMVAVLVMIAGYYWYNGTYFVSTEDAKVAGDIVKVTPQISGKLLELNVDEGETLAKDQIIGRQEMGSLADSSMDQSVIRSPIDGFVIKKQGSVGEIASSGQTLVMMIDPAKMYINANIEETELGKIKIGQKVDIAIDEFKGEKMSGSIQSIGKATNSAFSLLSTSTSGTFTKVVQRVPVKIAFDKQYEGLLLGTNAIIKIHVK